MARYHVLLSSSPLTVSDASFPENSAKPCDTGTDPSILAKEYPSVDFSTVDPIYPAKSGPFGYNLDAVLQRGAIARAWLAERPEQVIAVVTHSAFLRTSVAHARFAKADYRVFDLIKHPTFFSRHVINTSKFYVWGSNHMEAYNLM